MADEKIGMGLKVVVGVVALGLIAAVVNLVLEMKGRTDERVLPPPPPSAQRPVKKTAPVEVSDPPEEEVVDAPPGVLRSRGCKEDEPPFRGFGKLSTVGGLRKFELDAYVPKSYSPGEPAPVLLFVGSPFHKLKSVVKGGLRQLADREGIVIGQARGTDSSIRSGWSTSAGSLNDHFEALGRELCVDEARRFAVGSEGGAYSLANAHCRLDAAAMATLSARPPIEPCKTGRPTPHIFIAETASRAFPLTVSKKFVPHKPGGRSGTWDLEGRSSASCLGRGDFIKFGDYTSRWRETNGCGDESEKFATRCQAWSCTTPFVTCKVPGGSKWHDSTSGRCRRRAGNYPYAETIWKFFESVAPAPERPDEGD